MRIAQPEREALLSFIEGNLGKSPRNMDEGIGTVYERLVFDDYFRALQTRHRIERVLECPADGVSGVPGINSLEFARNGAEVWLANPSQRMLDAALPVWERNGLADKVRFSRCEIDELPFEDDHFDFVWNFCMFERLSDPAPLVSELRRVSRQFVFIMTQNARGFGTPFHSIYHSERGEEWDHGYRGQMTMGAIRKALTSQHLTIDEEGGLDIPPWLDTWDLPMGAALKQLTGLVGRKWEWSVEEEAPTSTGGTSRLIEIGRTLEAYLPSWFKKYQAHHLYILARK